MIETEEKKILTQNKITLHFGYFPVRSLKLPCLNILTVETFHSIDINLFENIENFLYDEFCRKSLLHREVSGKFKDVTY